MAARHSQPLHHRGGVVVVVTVSFFFLLVGVEVGVARDCSSSKHVFLLGSVYNMALIEICCKSGKIVGI